MIWLLVALVLVAAIDRVRRRAIVYPVHILDGLSPGDQARAKHGLRRNRRALRRQIRRLSWH